jgi:hypothetical protein
MRYISRIGALAVAAALAAPMMASSASARDAVSRQDSRPMFVGITKVRTNGRIEAPGADVGLASAAALCGAEYGDGAHMCTVNELYDSVVSGRLTSNDRVPKSWIFHPSLQRLPNSIDPEEGVADSCGVYTYGTADHGWTGVAFVHGPLRTGYVGMKLLNGHSAPCGEKLPIACCR